MTYFGHFSLFFDAVFVDLARLLFRCQKTQQNRPGASRSGLFFRQRMKCIMVFRSR